MKIFSILRSNFFHTKKIFLSGKSHTFYKWNVWQNKSVVNSVGHNLLVVWHWCLHHFGCPSYLLLQPFYSLFCSFEFKRSNELYVFIFCQKILKRCERIRWIYTSVFVLKMIPKAIGSNAYEQNRTPVAAAYIQTIEIDISLAPTMRTIDISICLFADIEIHKI